MEIQASDGDFGRGPDVLVMSSLLRWQLLKELYEKGGPEFRDCKLTGRPQLHFHGIPVLTGRVKDGRDADTAYTEVWALKLFGPTGVRVLHVGGDSSTFGVRIEKSTAITQTAAVGPTPSDASNVTSGMEVFGVYSLLIPEVESVARVTLIPAAVPA